MQRISIKNRGYFVGKWGHWMSGAAARTGEFKVIKK